MKKKILITGMNTSQSTRKFYIRQQLKLISSTYSIYNCLVDMGYDVEQRSPAIGEDLSMYDEVIVYMTAPRSLVTTRLFEALWAISQHPNCILAFDDWQVGDVFAANAAVAGKNHELFADFVLKVNDKTADQIKPYEAQFMAAFDTIAAMKNRILACTFSAKHLNDDENYGPHLLFNKNDYPRDRIFSYNPSPYYRNRKPGDYGHEGAEDPTWTGTPPTGEVVLPEKERRFNFASLVQSRTQKWLKKQGYTGDPKKDEAGTINSWPVDLYGSRADSQKRLTEDKMCQVIARDWGCLLPGYYHAGSGWHRNRVTQCADANAIIVGDEKELRVYYGDKYSWYSLKASDLTELSDEELAIIAADQKKCLYDLHPLDKSIQQKELSVVLSTK